MAMAFASSSCRYWELVDWLSNFLPSSEYGLLFNALYNLHNPIRNQVPISCGT